REREREREMTSKFYLCRIDSYPLCSYQNTKNGHNSKTIIDRKMRFKNLKSAENCASEKVYGNFFSPLIKYWPYP
ncbi:hypothetical protein, partial [Klebsiella pneumoniae]|uniref:hypothetical protein n=1 Tax=Klebsiella pneumoniae TaxID=573 RepID=UPI003EB7AA7E